MPTIHAFGDRAGLVLASSPPSKGGVAPVQGDELSFPVGDPTAPPSPSDFIALKMTSQGSGSITLDIAAFNGPSFVETLHSGVVITGFPDPSTDDEARRGLVGSRVITGLAGVPDGSILVTAGTIVPDPWVATVSIINIETGVVSSKVFVPDLIAGESQADRIARGSAILGNEIFVIFSGPGDGSTGSPFRYVQIGKFPADLSGQTVVKDHAHPSGDGSTFSGTIFFPTNALYPKGFAVSDWNLMPYGVGGVTEDHITGGPDPGGVSSLQPWSLGLLDGAYWTVGNSGISAEDILLFKVIDLADAEANGWTDVGLAASTVFRQDYNGGNTAGFNFNVSEVVGFPIWDDVATTAKPGVMRLPLTATDWAEAIFTELETGDFRADMALPDMR